MSDIQQVTSSNVPLIPPSRNMTPIETVQSEITPEVKTTNLSLHISSEAQYLFEIDSYLMGLDEAEQNKALGYLSQSNDPLQSKAVGYFKHSQELLSSFTEEQRQDLLTQSREMDVSGKHVLGAGFVDSEATRIVVFPLATDVFRLDGNQNFYPVTLGNYNTELTKKLDAIEPIAYDKLDNQDAANLIGSVRFALGASENILTSFDDVLHLNYSVEKAKEAISFIDVSVDMKAKLTDILNQGLAHQNEKQTRFIEDTKRLVNDGRVGVGAAEDVRLASAAQSFNTQLKNSLKGSNLSVLDAGGLLNKLLTENTDLIRFPSTKVNEALSFYRQDFSVFQKALSRDFSQPEPAPAQMIDTSALEVGSKYALNVISQIEAYVSKN